MTTNTDNSIHNNVDKILKLREIKKNNKTKTYDI